MIIYHDDSKNNDDQKIIQKIQKIQNIDDIDNRRHLNVNDFENQNIFRSTMFSQRIVQMKIENRRFRNQIQLNEFEILNRKLRASIVVIEKSIHLNKSFVEMIFKIIVFETFSRVETSIRKFYLILKIIKFEKMKFYKNQNENKHQR